MSIDETQVKKIAHLAQLSIADQAMPEYTHNLTKILNLVAQINAIDTTDVTPMAHPLDMALRLREDQVTENNQRELYLSIAPKSEAGLYLVPQVIE